MTNRRSVVISGDLGSGKSTVSQLLATRLGLPHISMGDLHRGMAQERGMSALQLNLHAERDVTVDDHIDQLQVQIANTGNPFVVDSRLAWFFFTDALKIHLIVDPVIGAKRVMSRPASDVESYSSITEAVSRLRERDDSERVRFIRKYEIDKARLRNYDMICDSSRAQPENICEDIIAALKGDHGVDVLSKIPPLLDLDPSRILPSQNIKSLGYFFDSAFVAEIARAGHRALDPISVAYCDRYFYVIDGHRRLSAAIRNGFTLVPARLVAEADETVAANLSACKFLRSKISLSTVHDWEMAHGIQLPSLPLEVQNQPLGL
jgi:cytidylate kinase